ncbi:MAG: hypothetical protein D6689_19015 [Deltaproteobacteria bacterium]|nr:MAG: hypothetical protein D6689_19015 [Deltaproteobacteria bacterium]
MAEQSRPASLRAEPYRLLFPLGLASAWLGVSHWLLYGLGALSAYSGLRHALLMTEAMFSAFALGFLMTAVPRRTQTLPAHAVELVAATAAVVATALGAQLDRVVLSQAGFLAAMSVLLAFVVRRTEHPQAGRRPPNAFVLIPIGAAAGIAGAVAIARMANGQGSLTTYLAGRELVQQGPFLCIVLGAGALLLPLIEGLPPPPDAGATRGHRLARLGYAALGLAIVATLVADPSWPRAARAARAALVTAGLVASRAGRWPRKPGLHRRAAAASVWLVPAGLALAAAFPDRAVAGLHVAFIGGLSLLVLAASAHVAIGHGARSEWMARNPRAVAAMVACVVAATVLRATAHWWPEHLYALYAAAAALWLAGSVAWLVVFVLAARPPGGGPKRKARRAAGRRAPRSGGVRVTGR